MREADTNLIHQRSIDRSYILPTQGERGLVSGKIENRTGDLRVSTQDTTDRSCIKVSEWCVNDSSERIGKEYPRSFEGTIEADHDSEDQDG